MVMEARRWQRHPVASRLCRAAVLAIPLGAGVGAGLFFAYAVPRPVTVAAGTVWWVGAFGISSLAVLAVDRCARRILPLALLLDLGLLFPEPAPSRFGIALRAGSARRLRARAGQIACAGAVSSPPIEQATTLLTLVIALNAHDRRTRGHSERVRALTDVLARQLCLSDHDTDRLRWAALLHDIGKLSVPPAILNKAGKPDPRELAILRSHPAEGARIAAPLASWLGSWFHGIDEHHERYDGNGYPRGLDRDTITLAGRIVSITDAFETMTAVRAYKRPLRVKEAQQELIRCAGAQFDPQLVRAFLDVSIARLYWALRPLAWLVDLPLIGPISRAGVTLGQRIAPPVLGAASVVTAAGLTAAVVLSGPLTPTHVTTAADPNTISIHQADRPTVAPTLASAKPTLPGPITLPGLPDVTPPDLPLTAVLPDVSPAALPNLLSAPDLPSIPGLAHLPDVLPADTPPPIPEALIAPAIPPTAVGSLHVRATGGP
jgi:hypothetical protein